MVLGERGTHQKHKSERLEKVSVGTGCIYTHSIERGSGRIAAEKTHAENVLVMQPQPVPSIMKLPDGYGSVTKLSGNRRKPYLSRVTLGWITNGQTGKTIQNHVPIGTFKTKKEALQALAEYAANPYDIQNENITLADDIIREREEAKRGHIILQEQEIEILWANVDKVKFVDWILIQCYMGWRPH